MRLADTDWTVLRGALAALVLSLALAGGMLAGSYWFWQQQDASYQKVRRQLASVRAKYQTVDEEERIIETYLPRYRALESDGLIGREHRLNWIEVLRASAQELKLPALRYSISAQEKHTPDFEMQTRTFEVYATRMNLTLGLLHEEDLARLLDRLQRVAVGLFSTARCTVQRVGQEFTMSPTEANLSANCDLSWFTVKQPEGPERRS